MKNDKPTEKQKEAFKAKLKKNGLESVNYANLKKWQKDIYNGLKSVKERSGIRIGGKFIAAQQERKLKKIAGQNIDLKNPTPDQKKAIENILSNWIQQDVNNVRLIENVNRYSFLQINGRPVEKVRGLKFLADLILLIKTKHNAAHIIFKTLINEKTRTINVIVPQPKK